MSKIQVRKIKVFIISILTQVEGLIEEGGENKQNS